MKETSTSKLREDLKAMFMKRSGHNRLYLKKKFFRFGYLSGTSIYDHIAAFSQSIVDFCIWK